MQRQAIITRYHGPTNSLGSRITAFANAGRMTVSYDPARNPDENHRAAMMAFCERFQWEAQSYHPGGLPDGSTVWVHVTRESGA